MNVYKFIRDFAEGAEVNLEAADVARIASVLKTAGFTGEMSKRDQDSARPIVAKRIGQVVGASPSKVKTAGVEDAAVQMNKDASNFEKIDAAVQQGKCARCGKPTKKVHLGTYEETNFCQECRTVLW
jgi:hypothetical protein